MNKKVLTLCAGFLLAGGMLSSLSAEKLSEVADNGKYYKMQRKATTTTGTWTKASGSYFIDVDVNGAVLSTTSDDYWKVVTVGAGQYQLISLNGQVLTVDNNNVFTFKEDLADAGAGFSQLGYNNQWVAQNGQKVNSDKVFPLVKQGTLTETPGVAFDAVESGLADIYGTFEVVVKDHFYTISCNGAAVVGNGQYKATVNGDGTFSFVENKANGQKLILCGSNDFTLITTGVTGQYLLKVGTQYVSLVGTDYKLTDTPQTIFAFDEVDGMTQLTVGDLVYYDLDAFTLNIYYDADKKTVAGDPFKGRLTPMEYVFGRMVPAVDNASTFFLKNEAGEYIVAKLWSKGNTAEQDVYTLTTVKEN